MSLRRSPSVAQPSSSAFDIKPKALSIRNLGRQQPATRSVIDRVRSEFAEMRGLSPTLAQAARLFDLSPDDCARLLGRLVQDGSLLQGKDGRYRLR
jgi:hypothetical protein